MQPPPDNEAAPFPIYPVPPELLAWAKQTLDMQEILDGIREIEAGRGHSFEEVIAAIEAEMSGS